MGKQVDPRYSDSKILNTIKKLDEDGSQLNVFKIRNALSGGSNQRIRKVLEQYQQTKKTNETSDNAVSEIPPEMEEKVESLKDKTIKDIEFLATSCFTIAMHTADQRIKSKICELNDEIDKLKEIEQDAIQALNQCEAEIEQAQTSKNKSEKEKLELIAENSVLKGKLSLLNKQLITLKAQNKENDDLKIELGKLQGKIEILTKQ